MNFYKLTARIANVGKNEGLDQKTIASKILQAFGGINSCSDRNNRKQYFIVDNSTELIGAMAITDTRERTDVDVFPWGLTDYIVEDRRSEEITSHEFAKLLKIAKDNGFINSIDISFCRLSFTESDKGTVGGILPEAEWLEEGMAWPMEREEVKAKANSILWKNEFCRELDRIYDSPVDNGKFVSHPVQYILHSDNLVNRDKSAKLLISALRANGRLLSNRYCIVNVSKLTKSEECRISGLFCFYHGCTVILNFKGADINSSAANALLARVKAYSKYVLTVICLPYKGEIDENEWFCNELSKLNWLQINDDRVDYADAKLYLEGKAEADNIEPDEGLFARLQGSSRYFSLELDSMYEDWYYKNLKTKQAPAYADVELSVKGRQKANTGSTYKKLMKDVIGLKSAKDAITQIVAYEKAKKVLKDKGFASNNASCHICLTGASGTGKTMLAKYIAQIFKENHLLSKGDFVSLTRADLIGVHVGETSVKAKEKLEENIGNVIFLDEFYGFCDQYSSGRSFADEFLALLVAFMEEHRNDTMFIFAGYKDDMKLILDKNEGLKSRISYHVHCDSYSISELMEISSKMSNEMGFSLSPAAYTKLEKIYEKASENEDYGNARFARNILEQARRRQAVRLMNMDYDAITPEDCQTLLPEDIKKPKDSEEDEDILKIKLGFAA